SVKRAQEVREPPLWKEWVKSHEARNWLGWAKALSRSMGFTDSDLANITDKHLNQIRNALARVQGVAAPFIQYAESDEKLVEALYGHLVGVQGFRRVAILYRDTEMKAPGVGGPSSRPERKVYGPALRDDFREQFKDKRGCLFLDAPYPEAPLR